MNVGSDAIPNSDVRSMRWGLYGILIALSVGDMTGRLMAVNAVNSVDLERSAIRRAVDSVKRRLMERDPPLSEEEFQQRLEEAQQKIEAAERRQRPFLSANDRSRWLAIRALVEHGQFAIDPLLDRHVWNTIDMVQHRDREGELRLYSSKPPLLATLLAGEYWLIVKATGMTLGTHPYVVGRIMLLTINVLPMALLLAIVAALADRFSQSDFTRVFIVAGASLATMLSPMAVVLNNHTVAAVSAAVALYAFVRIWFDGDNSAKWYAAAGGAAAFTASCELPATSLLGLLAVGLLLKNPGAWLRGFLPAVAVVAIAFFATNYAAHESLRPPYMHRSETNQDDNWYDYSYTINGREIDSYWRDPQGIDRGEPSRATYALHSLIGHHGIFSLTPIWLMSLAGMAIWIVRGPRDQRTLAAGIALLTIVCLVFFIALRPQVDRNYGGNTSGFRWMYWFAPLWLVCMAPALDRLAKSRMGQAAALTLLTFSVISASYPTWNPWTPPWIYRWLETTGWQGF